MKEINKQIRHSGKYSISSFLRLHRKVTDLEWEKKQIINVFNHDELQYLQGKEGK